MLLVFLRKDAVYGDPMIENPIGENSMIDFLAWCEVGVGTNRVLFCKITIELNEPTLGVVHYLTWVADLRFVRGFILISFI